MKLKDHWIKLFFFCLIVSLIIGLSVKYGIKGNESPATIQPSISPDTNSLPPVIASELPTLSPTPSPTYNPTLPPTPFPTPSPTYVPSESPTSLPVSPTMPSTQSPITQSPTYAPTNAPTTLPITNPPTPKPTCKPVINGKIGDCCHWGNTCKSRICANTQQSNGTKYHNTCLPADLQTGKVCWNDESCLSESCVYNFSKKHYVCF